MSDSRNYEERLKEEAIKWAKHFINERIIPQHKESVKDKHPIKLKWELYYYYCENCTEPGIRASWKRWDAKIQFIKNFFNITEEDLK